MTPFDAALHKGMPGGRATPVTHARVAKPVPSGSLSSLPLPRWWKGVISLLVLVLVLADESVAD